MTPYGKYFFFAGWYLERATSQLESALITIGSLTMKASLVIESGSLIKKAHFFRPLRNNHLVGQRINL